MLQGVKKVAAATFLSKRTAVCGRRFSSVSAWSLCSRTADLQGNFSPEARKTRPGGKAAGYDCSQRACEPSDTSQNFFDSLTQPGEHCSELRFSMSCCSRLIGCFAKGGVVSRVMRKKVSRQRKKRVVMQWRNRREQPPGASCSCISCCPTECLRHGAGERRRALGRNCRQGRHPRPGCAYGSRG